MALPESRTETIPLGGIVSSSLIVDIQDAIVVVFHGNHDARWRSVSMTSWVGTGGQISTGLIAIDPGDVIQFEPDLDDGCRITGIRARMQQSLEADYTLSFHVREGGAIVQQFAGSGTTNNELLYSNYDVAGSHTLTASQAPAIRVANMDATLSIFIEKIAILVSPNFL